MSHRKRAPSPPSPLAPVAIAPALFAPLLLAATRKQLVDFQARAAVAAADQAVADALRHAGLDPQVYYALDEATQTARPMPRPPQETR